MLVIRYYEKWTRDFDFQGTTLKHRYEGIPSSSKCLNDLILSLDTDYAYNSRPVKFAQRDGFGKMKIDRLRRRRQRASIKLKNCKNQNKIWQLTPGIPNKIGNTPFQ